MILAHVGSDLKEAVELVVVGAYVHGSTGEDIGWTHEHREADTFDELIDVVHALQRAPFRLVDAELVEHRRELSTVFSTVDILSLCT